MRILPGTSPPSGTRPSTNSRQATKPGILLVEDEDTVREVTRRVLEQAGYPVLACSGPEEAMRLALQNKGLFKILLTDIVMPEMNGPDLARRLRESQPGLITVFMSGYADGHVRARLASDAASVYVQKPFSVQGLLSRVAEAVRRQPVAENAEQMSGDRK